MMFLFDIYAMMKNDRIKGKLNNILRSALDPFSFPNTNWKFPEYSSFVIQSSQQKRNEITLE